MAYKPRWRGIAACDKCKAEKASVEYGGKLCRYCYAEAVWGKAWADKLRAEGGK